MRKYNFLRPLLIILVAFFANNIATLICNAAGLAAETTEMIAVAAMVIAALFTYMRLSGKQRKP